MAELCPCRRWSRDQRHEEACPACQTRWLRLHQAAMTDNDEMAWARLWDEFADFPVHRLIRRYRSYLPAGLTADELTGPARIGWLIGIRTWQPGNGRTLNHLVYLTVRKELSAFVRQTTRKKQLILTYAQSLQAARSPDDDRLLIETLASHAPTVEEAVLAAWEQTELSELLEKFSRCLGPDEQRVLDDLLAQPERTRRNSIQRRAVRLGLTFDQFRDLRALIRWKGVVFRVTDGTWPRLTEALPVRTYAFAANRWFAAMLNDLDPLARELVLCQLTAYETCAVIGSLQYPDLPATQLGKLIHVADGVICATRHKIQRRLSYLGLAVQVHRATPRARNPNSRRRIRRTNWFRTNLLGDPKLLAHLRRDTTPGSLTRTVLDDYIGDPDAALLVRVHRTGYTLKQIDNAMTRIMRRTERYRRIYAPDPPSS